MRINSKAGTQQASYDGADAGEGLAIFLSQNGNAVSRYRFLVKAMLSEGVYQVGVFYSSPPAIAGDAVVGPLSRMVAGAICPGATSWTVDVSCADLTVTPETADIILASSKCFTSPIGVTRVSERYAYHSGTGVQTLTLLPGQTVTGIGAFGLAGGGTIVIDAGNTIIVPDGVGIGLDPKAMVRSATPAISFTNVDWIVEYLESA